MFVVVLTAILIIAVVVTDRNSGSCNFINASASCVDCGYCKKKLQVVMDELLRRL